MLLRFLLISIALIVFLVIKFFLPFYIFLTRADDAITQYQLFFKQILETNFSKTEPLQLEYKHFKKYTWKIYNTAEASEEFEKLLTQALENYDKINGTIRFIDTYSFQQKSELVRILQEVRLLRWQTKTVKN